MTRLAQEWRNYCVYSGKHLPEAALNEEHVIPKSLGGGRCTTIRASRKLNSDLGSTIDARIAVDPIIQFGRRDANARGHSRKEPVPRLKGAHAWGPGDPLNMRDERYNLDIRKTGTPAVWDTKTATPAPPDVWSKGGFIIPELKIDHNARLRFTVKTLIGLGWKIFGPDLLSAVDMHLLRNILTANFQISADNREGALTYVDPFLISAEDHQTHFLTKLEPFIIRKERTTILMREFDETLEWTVACLGYLVGNIRIPVSASLLKDDMGLDRRLRCDRARPASTGVGLTVTVTGKKSHHIFGPRTKFRDSALPFCPMTLGNMRELGVRSLAVTCELCHHEAILGADVWPDAVLVQTFTPRMVCTRCGIIGADARPNWREMHASGNWQPARD